MQIKHWSALFSTTEGFIILISRRLAFQHVHDNCLSSVQYSNPQATSTYFVKKILLKIYIHD